MSVFVIAEAGVAHEGDLDTAFNMAETARAADADAVKFQTYLPHLLLRENDPSRPLLEKVALNFDAFRKLARHCEAIGIEFMSTPGDLESLRFLVEECGIKRIKIGSDDLTYKPLVESAYKTGLPVILSTGMATMEDIRSALPQTPAKGLTLLHCVSEYPCPIEHSNLGALTDLKQFGWPVGYSDHTADPVICMMAVALGAEVIEFHFNPGQDYKGVDFEVGHYDPAITVLLIRDAERILGCGVKGPTARELELRDLVRKDAEGFRRAV